MSRRRKTSNDQADDDDLDGSDEGEALDEALGSLNVGDEGQTRYFGRSACVEVGFSHRYLLCLLIRSPCQRLFKVGSTCESPQRNSALTIMTSIRTVALLLQLPRLTYWFPRKWR